MVKTTVFELDYINFTTTKYAFKHGYFMEQFITQATQIWEHTKDAVIDTIGTAADSVLPETFISDPQSRDILTTFDRIREQCKTILLKIHLLRHKITSISQSLSQCSNSYSQAFLNSDNNLQPENIEEIRKSIQKCSQASTYLAHLADEVIPQEIESVFDSINQRLKNADNQRTEFTTALLKEQRLDTIINSVSESSTPERLLELQNEKARVSEKVTSLKQIFSVESTTLQKQFNDAQKAVIDKIMEYHQAFSQEFA